MRELKDILQGEDLNIFLLKCSRDFKHWAERVNGLQIKDFHMEWFSAIQSHKRIAITAPTGYGKTELIIAYILWRCWYDRNKDFLIVSKALHQSVKILDRICTTIEDNELLSDLMPDNTVKTTTWTKTNIKTKTNCTIACRPYSENIKSYHADFLLADECASYKDQDIFFRFVVTRTNAKKGKVVAISTPEDITDLMSVLARKKTWWSRSYPAIINGKAIWEEKFGLEELDKIRQDIGDEAFEREYMVNPKAQASNAIYPADIVENCFNYEMKFIDKKEFEDSTVIIGADFAISNGPDADFDAYAVLEKHNGVCYLRHGETHKGFPINSKVDRLVELYNKYKALKIYIDPSSIGAAVLERLRNRGIPVMAPDFSSANRNRMLMSIREWLEDRKLIIPRNVECFLTMRFTNTLVQELISFKETKTKSRQDTTFQSKSKHDDTVMALALACIGAQNAREFIDYVAV